MNPLIGTTPTETLQNAVEALGSVMELLSMKDSGLCRLLSPIVAAIESLDPETR